MVGRSPFVLRVARTALFAVVKVAVDLLNGGRDGTKGIVVTGDGRVLLVWHSYVDGWQLPGGSCHRGESTADACARELREETGVIVTGGGAGMRRLGRYRWGTGAVVVHVAEHWTQELTSNLEIARAKFFPIDELPKATTGATRRRLAEWREGRSAAGRW